VCKRLGFRLIHKTEDQLVEAEILLGN
jgi:hypothetical protein